MSDDVESLVNFFIGLFGGAAKEVVIFIISLMPILELRGGLLAASLLHVEYIKAAMICVIGNVLPIPFVLLFLEKIQKAFEISADKRRELISIVYAERDLREKAIRIIKN